MNKKRPILFLLLAFAINFSSVQAQHCATDILHKKKMETDAQYRAFYEKIEQRMPEWSRGKTQLRTSSNTIVIPVVVHILYNTDDQNISDAQVHSQIDALNREYTASNPDLIQCPSPFKPFIGNAHINFCLATRTPDGDYTTGIERKYIAINMFSFEDAHIKSYNYGGLDAWDKNKYLNIWVCNLGSQVLGYTETLGSTPDIDGCVITTRAFGTIGNLISNYNRGRTTVHEVGHWLGLKHIWGDDGGTCEGSDGVDDTPNQGSEDFGCPTFPKTDSCSPVSPGIMFMNYMDYTDDACMYMFTAGQVNVMQAIIDTGRAGLLTSNGCAVPGGFNEINAETFIKLYPSPASSEIYVEVLLPLITINNLIVYDVTGREIMTQEVKKSSEQTININVSSLNTGMYTLILNTDQGNIPKRFVVNH